MNEEISESAIRAHVDAVWHGFVRARFVKQVALGLQAPEVHRLYLEVKRDKKVHTSKRQEKFVKALDAGRFVGAVTFQSLRTHYGD